MMTISLQYDLALPNRENQELFYSTPVQAVLGFFETTQEAASADLPYQQLHTLSQAIMVKVLSYLLDSSRSPAAAC